MTHEEEQDLNRQVAEAEGWYFDQELKLWRHKSDDPWRCPECLWDMRNRPEGDCELGHCSMRPRPIRTPPDYLHDKAWLWDVVTANRLMLHPSVWYGKTMHWHVSVGGINVAGIVILAPTPEAAVCRWVIAARNAGLEVRT
jgi:hypothetical protein